jgi:hypothetical protein
MKRTNGVTLRGNENIFDLTNRNIPLLDEDERERNERHSIICWGRIGDESYHFQVYGNQTEPYWNKENPYRSRL